MIVRIHERNNKILVSICDPELIGKIFSEGEKQIDLTADFYKGDKKTEEEAGDLLRNADYVNLVGKKAVALGIKEEVVEEGNILTIQDIPHAQATILRE